MKRKASMYSLFMVVLLGNIIAWTGFAQARISILNWFRSVYRVQHNDGSQGYAARAGQDKLIDLSIFNRKKNGFFLEVGLSQLGSNTVFLEKQRDWQGLRCTQQHLERLIPQLNKLSTIDYCCLLSFDDAQRFLQVIDGQHLQIAAISIRAVNAQQRMLIKDLCNKNGFSFFNRIVLKYNDPDGASDEFYLSEASKKKPSRSNGLQRKFVLCTTMYPETDPDRIEEYARCFRENCNNDLIEKICVFCERVNHDTFAFLKHPKIVTIAVKNRPTFKDLVSCANSFFYNRTVIIANSDIYFDATLAQVYALNLDDVALVLTRYNVPEYKGSWYRHALSYDSYIFKTPTRILKNLDFCLGHVGCDLSFVDRLVSAGYNVINPSLSIKTWHVHKDDYRAYKFTGEEASGWRQVQRMFVGFSAVGEFINQIYKE